MHYSGTASTQPGTGLLRLDTDLGSDPAQLSISGIPTPISANDPQRKPSFSSSWSFVHSSAESSQSSSGSSFASCPEPSTPEPHGLPFDRSPYSSSSPFIDIDTSPVAYHTDHKHAGSFYINESRCTPASTMTFNPTPWTLVHRPAPENAYGLQSSTVNGLLPACGDLTTSMTASLMAPPSSYDQTAVQHSIGAPWDPTTVPYQHLYGSQQVLADAGEARALPESGDHWSLPMRFMLPSSVHTPATVIPSEAMPPAYEYSTMDLTEDHNMDTKGYALPSPARSETAYFGEDQASTESQCRSFKSEPYSPTMHHSHGSVFITSGGRVSKHGKKSIGLRSGKPRTRNMHRTIRQEYAPGTAVPVTKYESKKFPCRGVLDGKICGKRFSRIEHLTRHEKTHNSDEVFYCPLVSCPKSKDFPDPKDGKRGLGRRDNWRDHLKTHLKPATSNAPRNSRCSHEVLFAALCESEGDQEAERQMALVEQGLEKDRLKNELKSEDMNT